MTIFGQIMHPNKEAFQIWCFLHIHAKKKKESQDQKNNYIFPQIVQPKVSMFIQITE